MSGTLITLRKTVVPISFGIEIEGRNRFLSENHQHRHIGFFYVTTDHSLDYDDSIEVVSQPLPPKMLCRVLKSFLDKYGDIGYEDDAGIHIHVTRTKHTEKKLEELFYAIEESSFAEQRDFFGRRTTHYAQTDNPRWKETRYSAVNWTNEKTIEIRLFGNKNYLNSGILHAIRCVKRTQAILNTKEKITPDTLRSIARRIP